MDKGTFGNTRAAIYLANKLSQPELSKESSAVLALIHKYQKRLKEISKIEHPETRQLVVDLLRQHTVKSIKLRKSKVESWILNVIAADYRECRKFDKVGNKV